MGRHSAPQESSDDSFERAAVALAARGASHGRHARPDEDVSADASADALVSFEDDALVPFEDTAANGFDDTAKIARVPVDEDGGIETVVEAPAAETTPQTVELPATAQPAQRTREHATAADVALIRAHSDVRARVVAAVLVPFVIYTAVMAVISKLDRSYLLWIWIPLISAGTLVGLFLDLGHRKYGR